MCGFTDVRKDEKGYYCTICGKRMPPDYEAWVRCSEPRLFEQLQHQCGIENESLGRSKRP